MPQKYQDDALHIALATYNEADAAISWNFKHMVKLKTIRGVNGINKLLGYKELEILTPKAGFRRTTMDEPKAMKQLHAIREKNYERMKNCPSKIGSPQFTKKRNRSKKD